MPDQDHVEDHPSSRTCSENDSYSDFGSSSPLTAPQTPRTPRPSELKVHHCPYEGCTKSFNRLSRLAEHERSHTGERIFKCTAQGCDKDFLRESHLKHHVKSAHTDVRDYVCTWDGCDKKFATGTRLRRHLAAHEGREKYRCRGYEGCNETFRKHATLTRHIMTAHEGQKAFHCPDTNTETGEKCTMAFDTAEKLRAHQRAQHDPTRFSCSMCLDAIMSSGLQEESADHDIEISQAYFPTYSLLQAHMSNVHPPICPYCQTRCSTRRELRRHVEGVHGILTNDDGCTEAAASHPCTYPGCRSSFTRKSNLNTHLNTVHKGKRSFVCGETDLSNSKNLPSQLPGQKIDACGRSFTSKSSLEEHVRTAHMGLASRQVERKHKKRAAEAASLVGTDVTEDGEYKPKRRKVPKSKTALATLTGIREDLATLTGQGQQPTTTIHGPTNPTGIDLSADSSDIAWPYPGYIPYPAFDTTITTTPQTATLDNGIDLPSPHNDGFGPAIDPLLLLS